MKSCWNFIKQQNKFTVILWLAAFLWMLFIFSLSSQPASVSNSLSKKVTMVLIDIKKHVKETDIISLKCTIDINNNKIRRYAHVVEYIILVILVINALRSTGMSLLIGYVLAFLISATFACSDEIHQMFVPGRGVQIQDFLRDCFGVLLGVAIYNICALLYKKSKY